MERKSASDRLVPWGPREKRLLARARQHDDRQAMDELFRLMLPLARKLARKYHGLPEPIDDLTQVASFALFKALRRFDPDRGVEFPAYAVPTIIGELKRYYRDFGWSVRVPRALQERVLSVNRELSRLCLELGRSPTPAELAARCELSVEEVLEAQVAAGAHTALPLDPPSDDEAPARPTPARDDPGYRLIEQVDALRPALRALPQRERCILALRFSEELTQDEIAGRIGISQMHVSRLLNRALDRIRPIVAHEH